MTRPIDHRTAELLRAVVQPPAMSAQKTIAEIAAGIQSWDEVIEAARLHGIAPMFYARIRELDGLIPQQGLDLARREFERNAFHCLANAAELLQVLKAFEAESIPAMPFKGVVLAASAYGDISMRAAGDLDFLIYAHDSLRAAAILRSRGYELTEPREFSGSPSEKDVFELHFERPSDGMVIEIRWRLELTTPRFQRDLGMDWVWPRRTTTRLAGADVPNLDPVSSLLVLCMHGSKHTWSRLIWICDVAKLIESQPQLDWEAAQREARRMGLRRCLVIGVLLANRVSGAPVPAEVLKELEADQGGARLAGFFAEHMPEAPGKIPNGGVPYNLMLLGSRDRMRLLFSPTLFRPNELDRAAVRLPKALEPLYYVIRPFRVLLDRAVKHRKPRFTL